MTEKANKSIRKSLRNQVKNPVKIARRPRVFLFWTLSAIMLTGIFVLYSRTQSPAVGNSSKKTITSKNKQAEEVSDPSDASITSKLSTFKYPGSYRLVRKEINPLGIEQYLFATQTDAINSNKIGVTIRPNGVEGGYTADSGYKLRKLNLNDNTFTNLLINGQKIEKSSNKAGTEIVYFFQGDLYYALLAGTTSNSVNDIEPDLKTIAKDWSWLK